MRMAPLVVGVVKVSVGETGSWSIATWTQAVRLLLQQT